MNLHDLEADALQLGKIKKQQFEDRRRQMPTMASEAEKKRKINLDFSSLYHLPYKGI
jgi:hypothetical protein